MGNKLEIQHLDDWGTNLFLNGIALQKVCDYKIRKKSAHDSTELVLVITVDVLHEGYTENTSETCDQK